MSGPAALGWPASCRIWRVCEKRVFLPGAARSAGLRSCPDGCVIVPGFPGLSRHSGSPASPVHAPSRLIGVVAHACTDACGAGMRSCLERRASPDGETVAGTENLSVGHHVVQFYGHDEELAERVAGYLLGALESGGVAIVIATPEHRHEFGIRLAQAGVDLAAARDRGAYLVLDASETLRELMAAD